LIKENISFEKRTSRQANTIILTDSADDTKETALEEKIRAAERRNSELQVLKKRLADLDALNERLSFDTRFEILRLYEQHRIAEFKKSISSEFDTSSSSSASSAPSSATSSSSSIPASAPSHTHVMPAPLVPLAQAASAEQPPRENKAVTHQHQHTHNNVMVNPSVQVPALIPPQRERIHLGQIETFQQAEATSLKSLIVARAFDQRLRNTLEQSLFIVQHDRFLHRNNIYDDQGKASNAFKISSSISLRPDMISRIIRFLHAVCTLSQTTTGLLPFFRFAVRESSISSIIRDIRALSTREGTQQGAANRNDSGTRSQYKKSQNANNNKRTKKNSDSKRQKPARNQNKKRNMKTNQNKPHNGYDGPRNTGKQEIRNDNQSEKVNEQKKGQDITTHINNGNTPGNVSPPEAIHSLTSLLSSLLINKNNFQHTYAPVALTYPPLYYHGPQPQGMVSRGPIQYFAPTPQPQYGPL